MRGSPSRSSRMLNVARLRPLNAGYGAAIFAACFAASEDWWTLLDSNQ